MEDATRTMYYTRLQVPDTKNMICPTALISSGVNMAESIVGFTKVVSVEILLG